MIPEPFQIIQQHFRCLRIRQMPSAPTLVIQQRCKNITKFQCRSKCSIRRTIRISHKTLINHPSARQKRWNEKWISTISRLKWITSETKAKNRNRNQINQGFQRKTIGGKIKKSERAKTAKEFEGSEIVVTEIDVMEAMEMGKEEGGKGWKARV
jgi:hypothetical protein